MVWPLKRTNTGLPVVPAGRSERIDPGSTGTLNTGKLAAMPKRGYSREFTPKTERRVRFEVDRIPPTLYDAVKAKATREGISLRALTLRLWKEWLGTCPRV